jgi:hypothetical protein
VAQPEGTGAETPHRARRREEPVGVAQPVEKLDAIAEGIDAPQHVRHATVRHLVWRRPVHGDPTRLEA